MFYDKPECIELSSWIDDYGTRSGIFLFKKAISGDVIKTIEEEANSISNEVSYENGLMSWYEDKALDPSTSILAAWEQISDLIGPEYVIHPMSNLLRIKPGHNGMFLHSDSPGKNQCHLLSQTDVFKTCCIIDFGVVAYFGDYEGGEIFYPNINPDGSIKENNGSLDDPCFEYKPEKGDVVIHSAFNKYLHGVREVKSGIRYALSTFALKQEDNPGTFYNYKTEEYMNQIGNKIKSNSVSSKNLREWLEPLKENPQFAKDKVKIMKESGLEGESLAKEFFSDLKE